MTLTYKALSYRCSVCNNLQTFSESSVADNQFWRDCLNNTVCLGCALYICANCNGDVVRDHVDGKKCLFNSTSWESYPDRWGINDRN